MPHRPPKNNSRRPAHLRTKTSDIAARQDKNNNGKGKYRTLSNEWLRPNDSSVPRTNAYRIRRAKPSGSDKPENMERNGKE